MALERAKVKNVLQRIDSPKNGKVYLAVKC